MVRLDRRLAAARLAQGRFAALGRRAVPSWGEAQRGLRSSSNGRKYDAEVKGAASATLDEPIRHIRHKKAHVLDAHGR